MDKWKRGILSVTELQKLKIQIKSTWLVLLGIALGLAVMAYNAKLWWWTIIILIAAFINTSVSLIGLYQKKVWLVKIEEVNSIEDINKEEVTI